MLEIKLCSHCKGVGTAVIMDMVPTVTKTGELGPETQTRTFVKCPVCTGHGRMFIKTFFLEASLELDKAKFFEIEQQVYKLFDSLKDDGTQFN